MNKVTQKQMAFYKLFSARSEDPERYVSTWEFLGEMFIKELNQWVLMSYKCPTRLTDLFQENPQLLERKLVTGKSGATYYGYRLRVGGTKEDIKDVLIKKFYHRLKNEPHS